MDEHDILDAPENEIHKESISLKLIVLTFLGFTITFTFFILSDFINGLRIYSFNALITDIDLTELSLLFLCCIIFYIFFSFAKMELNRWFRGVTISVSILFCALIVAYFGIINLIFPEIVFIGALRVFVFAALVAGGGCSLAAQFLVKKKYLVFTAIMICTIVFFSFIDKL